MGNQSNATERKIIKTPYDREHLELQRKLIVKKYQAELWAYLMGLGEMSEKHVTSYVDAYDWDGIIKHFMLSWSEENEVRVMRQKMRNELNELVPHIILAKLG